MMQLRLLIIFIVAQPVSEAWRYGCSVFGSLCADSELCDTDVFLGQCTSSNGVRKREVSFGNTEEIHGSKATPTSDLPKFVFIKFDLKSATSVKVKDVVEKISNHMGMKPEVFTKTSASGNTVTFAVEENSHGMGPKDVANAIRKDVNRIGDLIGIVIIECGTTNKIAIELVAVEKDEISFSDISLILICVMSSAVLLTLLIFLTLMLLARSRNAQKGYVSSTYTIKPKLEGEDLSSYTSLFRERRHQLMSKPEEEPVVVSTKKLQSSQQVSKWHEEPVRGHLDITAGHLILKYLEELCGNDDKLLQDWTGLCTYEVDSVSVEDGSKERNQSKNRYADVLPYDGNRVKLNQEDNMLKSDYINASFIHDANPWKPEYIATQGPLESTVADFWQMIWERGCVAIVMLTQLQETGLNQCYQYWPERGMKRYHLYEVHLSSEHLFWSDYVVRTIFLKNLKTNETRTVTQFHFSSWPNLGVPSSPKPLLDFRRKVKGSFTGQDYPIVVHDSAGIGRTGTYILIDIVLNRVQGSKIKEIDLAATVEHLRDQRMQMVKNKDQFEFALNALMEEVQAILDAMPKGTDMLTLFRDSSEDH
eukprot:m.12712 g.12712  ORF g.12712 m.12712 type:complete len:591 (+) comp24247_c1_seq1:1166-2938(+)